MACRFVVMDLMALCEFLSNIKLSPRKRKKENKNNDRSKTEQTKKPIPRMLQAQLAFALLFVTPVIP